MDLNSQSETDTYRSVQELPANQADTNNDRSRGGKRITHPADEAARHQVAEALRQLRRQRGMSLSAAAKASGLSRSFIAMVENGSTEIAVSRLIRLAGAYGVFAADLLTGVHSTKAPEFVKESDAYTIPSSAPGAEVRYLSTASWPIQPFVVTLAPGARVEGLSHAGAEFIHGLEGTMTMLVNGERYELNPGDTLVIPEQVEHAYLNETKTTARIVGGAERSMKDTDGPRHEPDGGTARPSPPRHRRSSR